MIWLTWRQFRVRAVTAAAALALFAILLAATGPHMASLYAASGITGCQGGGCQHLASNFLGELAGTYGVIYIIGLAAILLAPAIIGLFWGAPLIAAELDSGTYALAWNQSITRTRWLVVKLGLVGLAAMAVTEALSLMQAWWAAPIGRAVGYGGVAGTVANGRFSALIFASHGITPLGYAAFAFALGVTAGALLRRVVPAMAVTLFIFAALQVAFPLWIRPHLQTAHQAVVPVTALRNVQLLQGGFNGSEFTLATFSMPGQADAWVLSSHAVGTAGEAISTVPGACSAPAVENGPNFFGCLASHGVRESITYHPASAYWPLQGIETGIYLVLALGLAGFCFWRVSRRRM